ncbi:Uncharacterized protein OBRU01_18505 [Operophtera brumata]|uniref:Uncharacterized protein n=1 Tax=Operophtera brumata TaxID=104452 RepID=A0A0L7KN53_OPEBR|nr:Uncharacterized protein OBRU01_18505 [Operophtera brumata]
MLASYYQMKTSKHRHGDHFAHYYSNLLCRDPEAYQDLSIKCRVCLQDGDSSIYGKENADEISEALQVFGSVIVSEDDAHTKLLCSTCIQFINQAIAFRKVAIRSDELLKKPVKEELCVFEDDHDNSDSYETEEPDNWSSNIEISRSNKQDLEVETEKKEKVQYNSKVTCHICNKVINRSYFKEHVTMHDPDHKRYVCDICGKSFRLQCAYRNHSLRHSTGFAFKCQFCPYRAQYVELLKTHMRTHTGDYRYMCTECPARFLVKSNLNSHMLKHKEPQFKCDTCKRAFHTKLMLQRHYECDHLGIKNHVCNICGKAFGYRNAMMKHQRRVHKREKISFGRMPSYLRAENKIK